MNTCNTRCIPWLGLLQRPKEHFIHTQSIGTILLNNVVRIYHIVLGFRHFFNLATHYKFSVFGYKFGSSQIISPKFESINIQLIRSIYHIHIHMNRHRFVILLKSFRNKFIFTFHAISKGRSSQNHPLVDQLFERLILRNNTLIFQKLMPKTSVQKVTCSMFATTYVQIHILPIGICRLTYRSSIIEGIHITQIVPTTARPARHGGLLQLITFTVFYHALFRVIIPLLAASQWRLTIFGRQIRIYFRKLQRQMLLLHSMRHTIFIIYRNRLSPIALTSKNCVTQTEVYFPFS